MSNPILLMKALLRLTELVSAVQQPLYTFISTKYYYSLNLLTFSFSVVIKSKLIATVKIQIQKI